jgi:hypothetical protein
LTSFTPVSMAHQKGLDPDATSGWMVVGVRGGRTP